VKKLHATTYLYHPFPFLAIRRSEKDLKNWKMSTMAEKSEKQAESDREKGDYSAPDDNVDTIGVITEIVNASGHRDQLNRQYGILSICGMALTVDNAWVAVGTSLNVAICKFCKIRRSQLGADCPFPRQWRTSRCSI
jgi:hypothetical protein